MKRIIAILLVLASIFCFASCDKNKDDEGGDPAASGPIVYTGKDQRGWNIELTMDGTQATVVITTPQGGKTYQVNTLTGTVSQEGDVTVVDFTSAKVKITVTTTDEAWLEAYYSLGQYMPEDQAALWSQVLNGQEIEITPEQSDLWSGNISWTKMKCTLDDSAKTLTWISGF